MQKRDEAVTSVLNAVKPRKLKHGISLVVYVGVKAISVRIYVPSELRSVRNLHKIYNASVEENNKVTYIMFY